MPRPGDIRRVVARLSGFAALLGVLFPRRQARWPSDIKPRSRP